MNHTTTPARPPRQAVLLVCHANGWTEAYAERNVDIHIVQMPVMESPAGRIAAEQYLDLTLPLRYRDLYVPNKRRAADLLREVHPSDIAQRNWRLSMLHVLDRIGTEPAEPDDGRRTWLIA